MERGARAAVTQVIVGSSGGAPQPPNVFVVIGDMHIVCGRNAPTESAIKNRATVERAPAQSQRPTRQECRSCASSPATTTRPPPRHGRLCSETTRRTLIGRCSTHWRGGGGYHIAVSGAIARLHRLPVGKSPNDRGMRTDHRGVVSVAPTVALHGIGTVGAETPESSGVSQPAASDTHGEPVRRRQTEDTYGVPSFGRR